MSRRTSRQLLRKPTRKTPRLPALSDRAAGLLLHPTSLPGGHACGDLGESAHRFVDFLAAAGQRWWQMLPVHPVGAGYSPYTGLSAFAGATHLIALEPLVREGWLRAEEIVPARAAPVGRTDYPAALRHRERALRRAFARFEAGATARLRGTWARFQAEEADWLEDYSLFLALKRAQRGAAWQRWPAPLRLRQPAALRQARAELADELRFQAFAQWQFHRQWQALRRHCATRGIALLGDVPIFVALDSADAWAHRELFLMNRRGQLSHVAGVPPDAFSATGQRWGNPLYDWERHRTTRYAWWSARLRATLRRFDAARLDHFIGFVRYWAVPARHRTARNGRFRPGPGAPFLQHLQVEFGRLPLIAEDLGLVTPAVTALREQFALPGMRVLQFAFGGDPDNPHLPHHHERNSVVYTGTHDNDTLAGWAAADAPRAATLRPEAKRALAWLGRAAAPTRGEPLHWALIRMACLSPAALAIVPVQDVLGLDNSARMNRPGIARGNWDWRLRPGALRDALAERLHALASQYDRAPRDD